MLFMNNDPPKNESSKEPSSDPSASASETPSGKNDKESNDSLRSQLRKNLAKGAPGRSNLWLFALLGIGLAMIASQFLAPSQAHIDYSTFVQQVEANNVRAVKVQARTLIGEFIDPPLTSILVGETETDLSKEELNEPLPEVFTVTLGSQGVGENLEKKLEANGVRLIYEEPFNFDTLIAILWIGLMIGLAIMMLNFLRRTRDQMTGGGMLGNVTKSPARQYEFDEDTQKTFDDVAGLKGVKTDLKEIVDFLSHPEKFEKLGARVPKGVLLNGPPGTGKTLLAKAVAGEAGVPFFSINGSEFIQLFVGVGASRVRDLFATAKLQAPAILFIDEIDAIGRQRGAGLGGGHDEREQTLNQILSEMDGFSPNETVIVIAATNRPDVLDPALLRPGRFDRHITVDRPSVEGREQLFKVHTRNVTVASDIDYKKLAKATVGMTGADIMNLVNEAALWATRQGKEAVEEDDFEEARDKILMGDTRDDILTEKEKLVTAYHEAGHALLGWLVPSGNSVHKVTIIPRGRALGVTQYIPIEDRHNQSESEMRSHLSMMLAGRAAEELIFHDLSAGASSDLKRATDIARRMVMHWGMSDAIGPVAHHSGHEDPFLGREIVQDHRPYSEHTAEVIDSEVSKILNEAADLAIATLSEHRSKLDALATALLEREEIDTEEIIELIGPAVMEADSPLAPQAADLPDHLPLQKKDEVADAPETSTD